MLRVRGCGWLGGPCEQRGSRRAGSASPPAAAQTRALRPASAPGRYLDSKPLEYELALVKNPLASAGDSRDAGWIPGSGRSPGEGNGNPLQYS